MARAWQATKARDSLGFTLLELLVVMVIIGLLAGIVRAGALVFGGGHVVLPLLETGVVAPGWVGEEAVRGFTREFDGADLDGQPLVVSEGEIAAAADSIPAEVRAKPPPSRRRARGPPARRRSSRAPSANPRPRSSRARNLARIPAAEEPP